MTSVQVAKFSKPLQVITSKGKRCAVKSFWMEGDKVTLFGTDGSETDYDYDELLVVERAA
ncbi:hypothetical protein EA435_23685 [Escherichia coli]|nr:hypothetical protein EA435_23685 [Escherichia coli]